MKKMVYLVATALAITTAATAQKKLMNRAYNEVGAVAPNFNEARENIKQALEHPETKDDTKAWYTAGLIEFKIFEGQRNLQAEGKKPKEEEMYSALLGMLKYYKVAAEMDQRPDEKGKVKPKYLKNIRPTIKSNHINFYYGGGSYLNKKDWQKAYPFFKAYIEIPELEFMKEDFAGVKDTLMPYIKFYAAYAATQAGDHTNAIKDLEAIKSNEGVEENNIYLLLENEYKQVKDTVKIVELWKECAEKYPNDPYYINSLINNYISKQDYKAAMIYIDKSLERDPNKADFWDIKGRIYDNGGEKEKAIECYKKAIAADSTKADPYGSIGLILYNQAVDLNEKALSIKNNKQYNDNRNNVVKPAFKKALPYFEKAYSINNKDRQYISALRNIYYNLQMDEKFKKMDELLK